MLFSILLRLMRSSFQVLSSMADENGQISTSVFERLVAVAVAGPYTLDFTSSGRYMAVSGRKGHLGIVDMINLSIIREFQVCSVLVELTMWGFTFTN